MNCGITCVKYLMFAFNFAFTLIGIGMIAVGIVMTLKVLTISDYLDNKFSAPPILLIVIGSIVFIIAFYGCFGAIRESRCMVITFSVCLALLLLASVAVAAVAFVNKEKTEDVLTSEFRKAINNFGTNKIEAETVDAIQKNLGCCGADGPADYNSSVPKSCCVGSADACTNLSDETQVFQIGCVAQMKKFIRDLGALVGALAIGTACFMIIGIISGLCLVRSIRKTERGNFS